MSLLTRVSCVVAAALSAWAIAAVPANAAPTATVKLLKDINPGPEKSGPDRLARFGDSVYFAAYTPDSGDELWKTDGTRAGTKMVADAVPGAEGSFPRGIYATNKYVFFTVYERSTGTRHLWRTDGTQAGTVPVPGTADLPVGADLSAAGDLFFFETYQQDSPLPRVWATDGDAPPVEIGQGGSYEAATLGGVAYLPLAGPADREYSLWRTDGTAAGTSLIKSGLGIQGPFGLTTVGDSLYFLGADSAGLAAWRTDGTASGTARVGDLPTGPAPFGGTAALGNQFLSAVNGHLWATDGTSLQQLIDGQVAALQRHPSGRRAYAVVHGRLWRTNGTENGTRLVSDRPRAASEFVPAGDTTLFTARSRRAHGQRVLWQTDGTDSGTSVIGGSPLDHRRGFDWLTSLGDEVVFVARDRHHGEELFVARTR